MFTRNCARNRTFISGANVPILDRFFYDHKTADRCAFLFIWLVLMAAFTYVFATSMRHVFDVSGKTGMENNASRVIQSGIAFISFVLVTGLTYILTRWWIHWGRRSKTLKQAKLNMAR